MTRKERVLAIAPRLAAAAQTGTWDHNNYYTDQSLNADQFSYQGTTDNTVSGWNARAQVGTDTQSDPLFVSVDNADYRLLPTSPLHRAGVAIGGCKDFRGRVCPPDSPSVGAYQSTSGDPAATRSARN